MSLNFIKIMIYKICVVGVVVSILAFQAGVPGSIPGRRINIVL